MRSKRFKTLSGELPDYPYKPLASQINGISGGPVRLSDLELYAIRKKVYIRDRGLCILCYDTPVEIHEIVPRSQGVKNSSNIFTEENMVCLCHTCHYRWHSEGNFRNQSLETIKEILNAR